MAESLEAAISAFEQAKPIQIRRVTDVIRALEPIRHGVREDAEIAGFCFDSRKLAPGEVFVALKGEKADGHAFVRDAMNRGAVACILERMDGLEKVPGLIQVPDSLVGLGRLAAGHRRALPVKLVGLTGSVGKTTTKDLLHQILSLKGKARKTEGNFNNTIGLPIQLLKLRPDDDWFTAEMGMSTPGEIRRLMAIAKPDLGLWLSVQAVHEANFPGGLEAIARAKFELVEGLAPGKTLVYNLDDPLVAAWSARYQGPKWTYSLRSPKADVRGWMEPFPSWAGTNCKLVTAKASTSLFLGVPGRFNAYNLIAASAAALAAGLEAYEIQQALPRLKLTPHRSERVQLPEDVWLVDDCYNSNPHALRHAMRAFANLPPRHWRWLIVGDMLELGPEEVAIHARIGAELARAGFDRISFIGPLSRHGYEAAAALARGVRLEHFPDTAVAAATLDFSAPPGARIWCKASRGMRLEQVTQQLALFHTKKAP